MTHWHTAPLECLGYHSAFHKLTKNIAFSREKHQVDDRISAVYHSFYSSMGISMLFWMICR